MNKINQINESDKQLNNETQKKLESEIKNLNQNIQNKANEINLLKDEVEKYKKESEKYKNEYVKCKKENELYIKEIERIKIENEKYKKEIDKSNLELLKLNKILGGFQNNQNNNNELKTLRDENAVLKYQLSIKDKEINELKSKLQSSEDMEQKIKLKDVLVIYFKPIDNSFYEGIKCLASDTFAEVEEKLYKKQNEFRNTNNMFTANALPVLRFKKISENNIHDGDVIQLYRLE